MRLCISVSLFCLFLSKYFKSETPHVCEASAFATGLEDKGRRPDILMEADSLGSGNEQVLWKKSQAGSAMPLI